MPDSRHEHRSPLALFSWAMYDWANSSFATVIQTFVFAAYFTRQIAVNETVGTAQWGNTISLAGLLVALGGPILGALADQTGRRKPWIALFTLLCIVSTGLLWYVRPQNDGGFMALLLVGIGTVGFEFASIYYNAMLPDLAPAHRLGRWSGWGWGLGYLGGLACLVVALVVFVDNPFPWLGLSRERAEHVRATFPLVSAWFLLFSLPLFIFTPDRRHTGLSCRDAVSGSIRQLLDSARHIRQYRHIVRFLIARMFYIDALATIFAFGGVYAAGTFDMTARQVLLFGIGLNVTAGLGAATFALVDDRIGARATILLSLLGLLLSGAMILLVTATSLFWLFGLILGLFVGPAQASGRSYLARMAPLPLRNEMFGLLAFSGKATAFVGPLLVGWLTYLSGSQRVGMSSILLFFVIGFLLMLDVPADKVRRKESGVRSQESGVRKDYNALRINTK
jgi:UMF1 family MFS transporter